MGTLAACVAPPTSSSRTHTNGTGFRRRCCANSRSSWSAVGADALFPDPPIARIGVDMPRKSAAELAAPAVITGMPKRLRPPDTLSEGARTEFLRVVTAEKADHFRKSDLSLLCAFCESAALAERSIKEAMLENPPNRRWLAAWREATRTMKDLSLRLRLSPQSRQGHNHGSRPNSTPRPMDVYSRMRLAEKDDAEQGRHSSRLD